MKTPIKSTWYGLQTYESGLKLQQQAYDYVSLTKKPVVIGLEHYPVITLGKRAKLGEELSATEKNIKDLGFELQHTDRGGQATLHSPGQLVVYPIIPIADMNIGVRDFVKILQDSTNMWLQTYKIKTENEGDAGLKTDKGKILFIGLRIDRGITRHGISININNNLEHFSMIRACGVSSPKLDSLESRGITMSTEQAFGWWLQFFNGRLEV